MDYNFVAVYCSEIMFICVITITLVILINGLLDALFKFIQKKINEYKNKESEK